jgi:hypothetical protein
MRWAFLRGPLTKHGLVIDIRLMNAILAVRQRTNETLARALSELTAVPRSAMAQVRRFRVADLCPKDHCQPAIVVAPKAAHALVDSEPRCHWVGDRASKSSAAPTEKPSSPRRSPRRPHFGRPRYCRPDGRRSINRTVWMSNYLWMKENRQMLPQFWLRYVRNLQLWRGAANRWLLVASSENDRLASHVATAFEAKRAFVHRRRGPGRRRRERGMAPN